MKKKTLIIGAIAATAVLAGGWALAQSVGQGPPFMRGYGHDGIGPGMMQRMDPTGGRSSSSAVMAACLLSPWR